MNKTLSSNSWIYIQARKWFDRVNGNTYHTVKIVVFNHGEETELKTPVLVYGYDDAYQQTACKMLSDAGYKLHKSLVNKVNKKSWLRIIERDRYQIREFLRVETNCAHIGLRCYR